MNNQQIKRLGIVVIIAVSIIIISYLLYLGGGHVNKALWSGRNEALANDNITGAALILIVLIVMGLMIGFFISVCLSIKGIIRLIFNYIKTGKLNNKQ